MGLDHLQAALLRQPAIELCERECVGFVCFSERYPKDADDLPWQLIGYADKIPGRWRRVASVVHRTRQESYPPGEIYPNNPVVYLNDSSVKPRRKMCGWYEIPIDEIAAHEQAKIQQE